MMTLQFEIRIKIEADAKAVEANLWSNPLQNRNNFNNIDIIIINLIYIRNTKNDKFCICF